MFASIGRALGFFFNPAFFGTVLKAVGLTLVLFIVLLAGVEYGLHLLPTLGNPTINHILEWMAPVLMLIGLFAVGGPVTALFGSLYLDRVADAIEARAYAGDAKAPGAKITTSLGAGIRLAGAVILADVLLLPADTFFPGAGEVLTILVNGFLLGREYFELAALRHVSTKTADALRRRNWASVFAGGLLISVLSAIPFADFFAPLFGAALMVHFYKRVAQEKT
ncbi:MAG TPA: EI24 domain-containing protein [Rhizomicrobium sp.]|nr:EI24 domain-containing protein [Rhizomicrobium sp.]